MKIVFVSYHYWPPYFGGELIISIERFQSLAQLGHSITVLTSGSHGLPNQEDIDGIHIQRSPQIHESRLGRGLRRLVFPIWAFIRMQEMEIDIVHHGGVGGIDPITNCLGMLLINGAAKGNFAKTVYVHSLADTETEMFSTRGLSCQIRNIWLKRIDGIVSVSPALWKAVSRHHAGKSYLITNGIHDDIFKPIDLNSREKIRNQFGLDHDDVVFTFLGSVGYRKGFDLLAEAFLKLSEFHPNWVLWIIGPVSKVDSQNIDNIEVEKITAEIKQSQAKVNFFGKIDDCKKLQQLLNASDIFVFPTRKEGMPLSPIEAMSCGLPIIISKIIGVTDMLTIEGETGLFCQVNDANSLLSAMELLGLKPLVRRKMGEAARNLVVSHFSWQKHITEWERFYSSIMKDRENVNPKYAE